MTSTDTYQLKWHSHSTHLNGSVAALLRSERFTDVVLCTMEGAQIPAHKFILSSCSVYLSNLFEGQRSVTRMGGMIYVVLPAEISTKALKILVEYMYKGETTVSNEVLDTVLKAGEVLKIRGLWRQNEEAGSENSSTEKHAQLATAVVANKQVVATKKADGDLQVQIQPKIAVKKDDKLLKTFGPMNPQGVTRPMFIGPPKLVFIKTTEGQATPAAVQAALRPGGQKGQTILVTQAPSVPSDNAQQASPVTPAVASVPRSELNESTAPRVLRRNTERKYGKKARTEVEDKDTEDTDGSETSSVVHIKIQRRHRSNDVIEVGDLEIVNSKKPTAGKANSDTSEVRIKDEPEWDASSIEEEERSIAEMFHGEMSVKAEPSDEVDIEEDSLMYSPLSCELCAEVFTLPAAWVRHVESHSGQTARKRRKRRSDSDDTEETMALLRCDLCQKHFPNPAEWVRHVQNSHTEIEGAQDKSCTYCKKLFSSHASMIIHMRTHTGERPFVCGLCNKGFNVKSNLLRHLRTLHDQMISPTNVDEDESEDSAGPSEPVKRES